MDGGLERLGGKADRDRHKEPTSLRASRWFQKTLPIQWNQAMRALEGEATPRDLVIDTSKRFLVSEPWKSSTLLRD